MENTAQIDYIQPSKKFLLIFIGLIVLLIVLIVIAVIQSQGDIASVKNLTYTLPIENISLKYPSDWQINYEGDSKLSNDHHYSFILTSPNNFELIFTEGLVGIGGGCDKICQNQNIENINIASLNFYTKPLYIVTNGLKENSDIGDPTTQLSVVPYTTCYYPVCYGFKGKNTKGTFTITGGYKLSNGNYKYMDPKEFENSGDVKTAISILKSLSY